VTARRDTLAVRVAAVRVRLGLSQARFAARVGVSRNVVIRWEGGKHGVRAAKLNRIAKVGGVTVDCSCVVTVAHPRDPASGTRRCGCCGRLGVTQPARVGAPGAAGDGARGGRHHLGSFRGELFNVLVSRD
jgi:DNA-binding XRE family transcriptional regulator